MSNARLVITSALLSVLVTGIGTAQKQQGAAAPAARSAAETETIAAEQHIWDLFKQNDYDAIDAAFVGLVYVGPDGIVIGQKGQTVPMVKGLVTKNVALSEWQTRMPAPDVVVIAYKASFDQTMNGKKTPSPMYMTSVWHRTGGKWVPVSHSETVAAPTPPGAK